MKLFSNNIVPYASTEGDKIYPIVVDIKKGIKSGEAISFVTADNQVGVITVDFMDGNSSYSIEGCMVTSTIHRPDGTVLEIPCDIISQSTIEIPLGINGTYQEGTHTFDLKIVRGNGKVIGVPTMSYAVSGSLSSDDVVKGDDRLPVLTMVLDNAQDKLTRLDKAIAGVTNDLEVKEARDGEVTLNARLERDLAKGKIHFVNVEGSIISTESQEGYLENVEIYGNTWQDSENLEDIRSVGTKVEGQELYEIPVLSCGKNLFDGQLEIGTINSSDGLNHPYTQEIRSKNYIRVKPLQDITISYSSGPNVSLRFYDENKKYLGSNIDFFGNGSINSGKTFTTPENTHYLRFKAITTDLTIKYQLEEGTQVTSYEPYKEDKLTILSPVQLEKVGDVIDRIICKEGVWGVEKSIKTHTVSQDTVITRHNNHENGTTSYRIEGVLEQINSTVITSKFKQIAFNNLYTVGNIGHASHESNMHLYVRLEGETTTTTAKQQLQGMVIKHIALTPQFIPLPHDQQVKLRTFADRTNVYFETEIEPTIKASVPKSLGATVNTHTTQIDNLNKELDRVKKLEESTVSTVTTNKAFTTVAETTQGYLEDVKVEGKTLVNLAPKYEINYNATKDYDGFMPLLQNSYGTQSNSVGRVLVDIKPSTEYTVFFNVVEKEDSKYYNVNNASNNGVVFETNMLINSTGAYVFKVTSKSDLTNCYMVLRSQNSTSRGKIHIKDIVILEGDHTDKDLSYFEGLKSVGQSSTGESEEISVLSDNNFVSNEKYLTTDCTYYSASMSTTSLAQTIIYKSGNHISKLAYVVPCERNTEYTVSTSNRDSHSMFMICELHEDPSNGIKYYNYSENVVANQTESSYTIKTTDKAKYVMVFIGEKYNEQFNISLYTKQDKKQILYYNPTTQAWEKPVLREWDSIEKHSDGKYYYHKRSEEIVLNGSESGWKHYGGEGNTSLNQFGINLDNHYHNRLLNVKCDRFYTSTVDKRASDKESIYTITNGVAINTYKVEQGSISQFKQWLQDNPTTVVYQLAQEEVYECINLDLITYSGETHLIVNSGAIQPRITLKVLSNVANVVKLLQEKVSVLENKFIEGLKQVLSGNMMALAQLLYPEDFENNHEIQTLEL